VIDHIRKELREIEADPTDVSEWIDVVILAFDGAWRHGATPDQIIAALVAKQAKNEARTWPDWRTLPQDRAIEHDRSGEQAAPAAVPEGDGETFPCEGDGSPECGPAVYTDDGGTLLCQRCYDSLDPESATQRRAREAGLSVVAPAAASPAPAAVPEGCHKLDTPTQVFFYEQDFYVLSNFSSFRVHVFGETFDTSEAAYHWGKFPDRHDIRDAIMLAPSAHEAFKIAERHKADRRPDWDEVKADVMREVLRAKVAQHEYVRRKLLATGDRELIEDSWRDDVWGWGPNRDGQNLLGKLWMEIRAELIAAAPAPEVSRG
jgi:ribA/ribD-fused uncharacterized protein